ncbi:MAG: ATP-binding protein [Deltaproteobacteria bacterium]|nr:ATP-binding protein [Deltaproteobacteria bacterium]
MIKRLINPSKSNSFFLFGARGTGKSTYIKNQFLKGVPSEEIILIDLLLPETEDLYARNPQRLVAEVKAHQEKKPLQWIFIDEVQKVPRLLDVVHHLIEEKKIKFILTGSSARKLKRGSANLLAGRAFVYPLHPFHSFELKEKFDLHQALQWGTLPKVIELEDETDKAAFLKTYALTYLKEEIQVEQLVRRLDPFRAFLEVAAQCNGKILNFNSMAREVGSIDHKTILSYFQILEDTHLGFLLPGYHRSIRKSQSTHPKFYFFDTGVKRALEKMLDVNLKPKTYAFGDAFEHFVVLEIYRLNGIVTKDFHLSYFNDRGTEIDLVLSKPRQEILVEIKSNDVVDPMKVERFARIAQNFPHARAYWLSLDKTPQKIGQIDCLHWQEGLERIFSKTECFK